MSRFLATVNIFTDSTQTKNVASALSSLRNIEEVYEVAGEYDIVTWVCASTLEEFRETVTHGIMKINGVKSIITTMVLEPYKGPRCLSKQNSNTLVGRQEQ